MTSTAEARFITSAVRTVVLLIVLASPAWAAEVRCTTDEEKTLGRLQTRCDDGTPGVSPDTPILDRWETRVRPPRPVVRRDQQPPQPKATRP
jgi:hypothetical protein